MHQQLKVFAAAAVLAGVTACCSRPADTQTYQVAQVSTATLRAAYAPAEDTGTFGAEVAVDTGSACDVVDSSATADMGGVPLDSQQDGNAATCACDGTRFLVAGAPIPQTPEATITVADGSGEMTAIAPQLFAVRSVSVRGAPSQLRTGTRIYLDVAPADETLEELTASFRAYSQAVGYQTTLFEVRLSNGTVGQDGNGWYFDVPTVSASTSGQLVLDAKAKVATSTCTGAGQCEVVATAVGSLNTTVAP